MECLYGASYKRVKYDYKIKRLHKVLICSKIYVKHVLQLDLKPNYRISRVDKQPVDFVGYVFNTKCIKVRKSIKIKLSELIDNYNNGHVTNIKFIRAMSAYYGWLVNGDCKYLLIKLADSIKNKNKFVKDSINKLK